MGPVYATRLTILPDARHSADEIHDRTVESCYQWLHSVGIRYGVEIPHNALLDVDLRAESGTAIIRAEHLIRDDERAWRAVIVHPYRPNGVDDGSNLQIRVEIQARDDCGEEVVTIRVLIGSTIDRIRPLAYHFKTPGLVRTLLTEFDAVSIGNVTATLKARHLDETEMDSLVAEITRSNRFAPIVVVSRAQDEQMLCDPDAIASEIAGLGRVYVLPTYHSAYTLTEQIGYRLSCFKGAVRVYWPEFSVQDNPYTHPLWSPRRIETEELVPRLPGRIMGMLASASMIGIGSDTKAWTLYHSALEARTQAIIQRSRDLADMRIVATETDYYDAVQQLFDLQDEHTDLKDQLYRLEADNMALRGTLADRRSDDVSRNATFIRRTVNVTNVIDAVRLLQEIADPNSLLILPAALESAAKGGFNGDMDTVWRLLFLLQDGAASFHQDPHAKLLDTMLGVGATREQFKADTSETARNMYHSRYVRTWSRSDGRQETIAMRPHLSNGKGNAGDSLFIYWHVDLECRTFVVGHIGPKLRDGTGGY